MPAITVDCQGWACACSVCAMNTTRWWKYVEAVAGDVPGREIARTAEFDPSAVSRWKKGEKPRWDFVLKFARAYKRNVLEALVEAGFLSDEEVNLTEVKVGVEDLTLEELLEEALRRVSA